MYQFTTTTILNSATDSSGKPKWSATTNSAGDQTFFVKKVNQFIASKVTAVYKREAAQPKLAEAVMVMDQWGKGIYQLAVYLDYQGSQNSYYSRPTSYIKGKPLFYSFELNGTETATQVADKITKIVKHLETRFGEKWLNVSNSGATLTVQAVDEYQRFKKVAIQQYQPLENPCACADTCDCGWVDVLEALPADETGAFPDPDATIVQGREGQGTYTHLMKDLRLPTAANTSWLSPNQEERPVPGALYDQFTIEYVKERGIQGTDAVGDLVTSATLHVFYVLQGATMSTAFEAALTSAGLTVTDMDQPTGYPA